MSLNIKNTETEELARQLASVTGEGITRAVTTAVRERLQRVQAQVSAEVEDRSARLRGIANDAAGRWVAPYRDVDHGDLLYDDGGLPR